MLTRLKILLAFTVAFIWVSPAMARQSKTLEEVALEIKIGRERFQEDIGANVALVWHTLKSMPEEDALTLLGVIVSVFVVGHIFAIFYGDHQLRQAEEKANRERIQRQLVREWEW